MATPAAVQWGHGHDYVRRRRGTPPRALVCGRGCRGAGWVLGNGAVKGACALTCALQTSTRAGGVRARGVRRAVDAIYASYTPELCVTLICYSLGTLVLVFACSGIYTRTG